MTPASRQAVAAHAHALCKTIGERTLTGGGLAAAERYIHDTLVDSGCTVHRQTYRYESETVANLYCDLGPPPGEDPGAAPGEHAPIIVGAHYDTVPGTEGADDNASAVCVLLALAARLARQPPSVPVRCVAFTLEEPPAFQTRWQGSRVFVRRMRAAGEHTRGAIVLEMVGYTTCEQRYPGPLKWAGYPATGDFIGIIGDGQSRRLTRALKQGFQDNPHLPVESLTIPLRGWPLPAVRLSDHASFWDHGYPAVMVTDTAFFRNPHYHLPTDTCETLDFDFMARLVDSLELGIARIARDCGSRTRR